MEIIRQTLNHIHLGEAQTVDNLTLFPLLWNQTPGSEDPDPLDPPDPSSTEPAYSTLEEAIHRKAAKVTEVSEGGDVPHLLFLNEGDRPVLLVDGAALEGAKQNRILNLTILVPPRSRTEIPVSCVESGRWGRRGSTEFRSSDYYMFAEGRAAKMAQVSRSLQSRQAPSSDQGAVWSSIELKMMRMASDSPTGAMDAMYSDRAEPLQEFTDRFQAVEGQIGVVVGLNGRVFGMDLFDHPDTLRHYLDHIVRSYGIDALERRGSSGPLAKELATGFLGQVGRARAERYPAVGMGEDLRLGDPNLTGGALVNEGRLVHLAAFRQERDHARRVSPEVAPTTCPE